LFLLLLFGLCSVLDRSGSMAGERLKLAKETISYIIDSLQAVDRLGIITYDTTVQHHYALTEMTDRNKVTAKAAVDRIRVGGSTNLCGGLLAGLDLMRKRATKNEVASVLLFTDGEANVGYTTANDIIRATTDSVFAARGSNTSGSFSVGRIPTVSGNINLTARGVPVSLMSRNAPRPIMSPMPVSPMPMQQMQNPAQQVSMRTPVPISPIQNPAQQISIPTPIMSPMPVSPMPMPPPSGPVTTNLWYTAKVDG
jgi:hypothetical protein